MCWVSSADATLQVNGGYSLSIGNLLTLASGILTINGSLDPLATASLELNGGAAKLGGTINGGTIDDFPGELDVAGGTLNGATYVGTLNLTGTSQQLYVGQNGLVVEPSLGSNSPGQVNLTGNSAQNNFEGTQTFDDAVIDIGNSAGNSILYTDSTNAALTLGAKLMIDQTGLYAEIQNYDFGIVDHQRGNDRSGAQGRHIHHLERCFHQRWDDRYRQRRYGQRRRQPDGENDGRLRDRRSDQRDHHDDDGAGDGLTIDDVAGADTIIGGGSGETFVFASGFGTATIMDFHSHLSGSGHDTIELQAAMFGQTSKSAQSADWSALLADAKGSGANVVITDKAGDALTLDGLTLAALKTSSADFKFT